MIDPGIINRIVYAKYLFWQGNDNLDKSTQFSEGIAVLNYQDSVEMVLRAIGEYLQAPIKDKTTFDGIIDLIEGSDRNKENYKFQYRSSLSQLNKSRVGFKHYGLLPIEDDVQKFSRDIESFYKTIIPVFFKISYESISLINLVKKQRVKNYLEIAKKNIRSNDFKESIIASAKAFHLLFVNIRDMELDIDHNLISDDFDKQQLIENIKKKLDEHEIEINILKHRINLSEYHLFKNITPIITMYSSRRIFKENCFRFPNRYQHEFSEKNADFCLRFVVDSALNIQSSPIIKSSYSNIFRKFKVIEESDIIVHPEVNDVEFIRKAPKDEWLYGLHKNNDTKEYYAIIQDDEQSFIKKEAVSIISETESPFIDSFS